MSSLTQLKHLGTELRRRRVGSVAVGYGVGAWLLLQVSDVLAPIFEVPPWVLRGLVFALAAGFFVAVALAWIYDLKAGKLVRTDALPEAAPPAPSIRPSPAASARFGPTATVPAPSPTALVGRERERGLIAGRLDALSDGQGSVVLVGGEPGIGKSRLAREALAEAGERGYLVLVGRCHEEDEAEPFGPFLEVMDEIVRAVPADAVREALGPEGVVLAHIYPGIRRLFAESQRDDQASGDLDRRQLFQATFDFLVRGAAQTPIVVFLDDLHWTDESSAQLLLFLAERLARVPMLVIGTHRESAQDRGAAFSRAFTTLTRQRLADRIQLKSLSPDDVQEMIAVLGGSTPPDALARVLFEETEGNPFFIEEVFYHLEEEGRLFDAEGGWRTDFGRGELDVPEGVRVVVNRRIQRLDEASVAVLTVAAVVGRDFDIGLVEAVSGLDEEAFLEAVDEAEALRVIGPSGPTPGAYQFTHDLIRQSVLAGVSAARQQRLHAQVGTALEAGRPAEGSSRRLPALAFHFDRAGAAGPPGKAVEYALAAGEQALGAFAYDEAATHFQRGLDSGLADEGSLERGRLLFGLGRAQGSSLAVHEMEIGIATMREALEVFAARGDVEQAVAVAEYPIFVTAGHRKGVTELLSRARSIVPPDSIEAGRLSKRLGWAISQEEGDYDGAMAAFAHAVEIAERESDVRLETETLATSAFVNCLHLNWPHALQESEKAIALAAQLGDAFVEMNAATLRAAALTGLGGWPEGEQPWKRAEELGELVGGKTWLSTTLWFAAGWARLAGKVGEARRLTERGLEVWPEDPRMLGERALLGGHFGTLEDGEPFLDRMVDVMRSNEPGPTDEYSYPALTLPAFTVLDAKVSRLRTAREAIDVVVDAPTVSPFIALWGHAGGAVRSLILRDAEAGERHRAFLEPYAGTFVFGGSPSSVDRLLGHLATLGGRREEAIRHFGEAVDGCRRAGYDFELAWALRDLGQCLGEGGGDGARAGDCLAEARGLAAGMGAKALLRVLDA